MPQESAFTQISRGVLGRMNELKEQQRQTDLEQQSQLVSTLSGLIPQVEPSSRPALLGLLTKTLGIKDRGFSNVLGALSLMPSPSVQNQLGDISSDLSNRMIGPQEAQQARETYKQDLLKPYQDTGTRPRSVEQLPYKTPPSLQGKIIFQDPQAQIEASRKFEAEQLDKRLDKQAWIEEQKERLRSTLEGKRESSRMAFEAKQEEGRQQRLLQQQRLAFSKDLGDQIKFYRQYGVDDPGQARRLALNDYSDMATQLGIEVPPPMAGDNGMLAKVRAQISRLQMGGRADKAQTWVELSDGSLVEADKVNFDRLPVGVTVKKMFTTMNGQPIAFGGGLGGQFTVDEAKKQIDAMKGAGKSMEQINAAIEEMIKDNPKLRPELEKLRTRSVTLTPLQQVEQGASFSESLLGRAVSGIGERYDKSTTTGWLRTRLQAAETRLSIEQDPAKRAEFQSLVNDLRERLSYAESQMGLSPSTVPTQENSEDTHRRAELGAMKSEVDWLKAQLDYAQKQMAIAPGVVQRETLRKQIVDLKRRLTYAEGELKKAAPTSAPAVKPTPPPKPAPPSLPFGYIQR